LAAYRPTGKGRVERQVNIVRDHVLAGRSFDSIAELDGAFASWLPIRRRQVHRTHGQVIAVRAEADRAALSPLPEQPYLVAEKYLRRVGKDCLVCFEASCYSVPARLIWPGQRVQLQILVDPVGGDQISIHALATDGGGWLASHHRATRRGEWVIDPAHWDGLPDGHTRAVAVEPSKPSPAPQVGPPEPLSALLTRRHADLTVAARPLTAYAHAANQKENT
jgi:hypothetical protein